VKHDEEKRMITRYRTDATAGGAGNGFAASRKFAAFMIVLSVCLSNSLGMQRTRAQDPKNPAVKSEERTELLGRLDQVTTQSRLTPLGVQVPIERESQKQRRGDAKEPGNDGTRREAISKGNPDQSRNDMVAEGIVTVHASSGPIAFGVSLIQNGEQGGQRILLRQPDGKLWDGRPDHLPPGASPALEFLETQYRRGLRQWLKSTGHDVTAIDSGIQDSLREVTVQEENGQSTKYSLDPATARIARFEFVRGEPRSVLNTNAVVHSYSFDDFRSADGIATPFRIAHFVDGVKREELQLKTARYNSTAIGSSLTQPLGR
jgi:hypothetical protein